MKSVNTLHYGSLIVVGSGDVYVSGEETDDLVLQADCTLAKGNTQNILWADQFCICHI